MCRKDGKLLTVLPPLLQTALDPRCRAAVCYFATDIHSASLSPTGDDSLDRASKGEIQGEVVMIFGTQDGHVVSSSQRPPSLRRYGARLERGADAHLGMPFARQPLEGRNKIRNALTASSVQPPLRLSFLELQANHAFIRYANFCFRGGDTVAAAFR